MPKYCEVPAPAEGVAPAEDGSEAISEELAEQEEQPTVKVDCAYSITEDRVEGYSSTVKGYNVTNSLERTAPPEPSKPEKVVSKPLSKTGSSDVFGLGDAALALLVVGTILTRRRSNA